MTKALAELCFDPQVGIAELPAPVYPEDAAVGGEAQIGAALHRLARQLGWSPDDQRGAFAGVIPPGARVLVKPNFVLHQNLGSWGMLPLVTHQSLVRAAVAEALRAEPAEVLVGDAPLQGCDFAGLTKRMNLDRWADELLKREPRFKGVRDFRRTISSFVDGVRVARENTQSADRFVLFDLGGESMLEPITDEREAFRVTCYDPRLLAQTHAPGRHQYLVAREVIEADVIINLPKLKTHKKAGITCALKNLIGINGNKEYLPHHRIGGSRTGGDCYSGGSRIKSTLEYFLDQQNTATSYTVGKLWRGASMPLFRALTWLGESQDLEGSWSGNDTIWRTCLDLNRILLYGRPDGTLASEPQRRVIHLVDAVVAGHGDGPLRPQPLPMGLIFAGANAAAVDWVGAHLLGYDPARIPIAREAFGDFRWPLTSFTRTDVRITGDYGAGVADDLLPVRANATASPVIYPAGWRDAVDKQNAGGKLPAEAPPSALSENFY